MLRVKKLKGNICKCHNCGYQVEISATSVKEKTFMQDVTEKIFGEDITHSVAVIATYIEFPVCGERLLKQLDTPETQRKARTGATLELQLKKGKKLPNKQKKRLKSIEKMLYNERSKLKAQYWDEIYQSLNPIDEEKTEMADQEPILGDEVTNTVKVGERMNEHGRRQEQEH